MDASAIVRVHLDRQQIASDVMYRRPAAVHSADLQCVRLLAYLTGSDFFEAPVLLIEGLISSGVM